jgi:hypothetical protein
MYSTLGRLLSLLANFRLEWIGFLATNALAYFELSQIRVAKGSITLGQRVNS